MLQEGLVSVKAAIHRANAPVYEDVLRLGEKKALIQIFNGLNTKHGTEPGYAGVEFRYWPRSSSPRCSRSSDGWRPTSTSSRTS